MQLDSSILYVYIKELKKEIQYAIVRDVHEIDKRSFDFELYTPRGISGHLIFNTFTPPIFYWVHRLPKNIKYEPSQTFCMTLRKQLEGARISDITQVSLDRIAKITFDRIEAGGKIISRDLYAELIPSVPNLILTENGIIIDAALKGKKEDRIIAATEEYQLPANSNRLNYLTFSPAELKDIFEYGKNKSLTLKDWIFSTFNGFSTPLLEELCFQTGTSPDDYLYQLPLDIQNKIIQCLSAFQEKMKSADVIYIYQTKKHKEIGSPIPLSEEELIKKESPIPFISKLAQSIDTTFKPKKNDLSRQIREAAKKEERKQKKIKDDLHETKKIDEYKLFGNLLSIYPYLKPEGKNQITVDNLFTDPPVKVTIPIDPQFSISQNSQNYFKKYDKMKTRMSIGEQKLKESEIKSQYLDELEYFLDEAKSRNELDEISLELKNLGIKKQKAVKKVKAKTPSIEHVTIDGFTVYIGKNNIQNEYLTLHKAKKNDIWLHVKMLPGSHVVIASENQQVPLETIQKAAKLAAIHSKGKYSGNVDVDYTLIKNVKKIPLGPPGLVNYTHQKTLVIPVSETDLKEQKI